LDEPSQLLLATILKCHEASHLPSQLPSHDPIQQHFAAQQHQKKLYSEAKHESHLLTLIPSMFFSAMICFGVHLCHGSHPMAVF
jgi:hypothetical protein